MKAKSQHPLHAIVHDMSTVEADTIVLHGKPVSMKSDFGGLALLHGALQSAIASVDDALQAERAYKAAVLTLAKAG